MAALADPATLLPNTAAAVLLLALSAAAPPPLLIGRGAERGCCMKSLMLYVRGTMHSSCWDGGRAWAWLARHDSGCCCAAGVRRLRTCWCYAMASTNDMVMLNAITTEFALLSTGSLLRDDWGFTCGRSK